MNSISSAGELLRPGTDRPAHADRPRRFALARAIPRPRPELALLLVAAAVLNLWSLQTNGWANEYYSAAVRSMSTSWHAFLYGSFDPSGLMTVDKPPLALWVQALSARIFGVHSLSILVPQALMGVAAVGLVYDLTRRRWGRSAGFVAGLALATTPITVAVSRHNNPDALLVVCCAAALWFVVHALEDGRTRWLVLAGVSIGLGFETKMAAALLIVPALAAAWLWVAPRGRRAAIGQLFAGGGAMIAVGGAWPLLIALTPASSRPWVSGTSDNSILSLIFGYNGLGRLDGQAGGPQALGGGGGGGGGFFGGASGPLRLLNASLGGQAGWLLGFALVAAISMAVASRLRPSDKRTGWLIAVGGAFATTAVAFSFAQGIFHPYYVSLLAPFTAALVGAGFAHFSAGGTVARVAAPLAIAGGIVTEVMVIDDNTGLRWVPVALMVAGVVAAVAIVAVPDRRVRTVALGAFVAALLIAPSSWAVQTLGHATSGTFPSGGPASTGFGGAGGGPGGGGRHGAGGPPGASRGTPPNSGGAAFGGGGAGFGPGGGTGGGGAAAGGGGGGMFGGDSSSLTAAVAYAKAHGGGTIAVSSQSGAATQVITSGADVAGIGGFSGRESQVSISWLADAVRSGRIRWVLTGGDAGGMRDSRVGSTTAMAAVAKTCKAVSLTSSGSATTSSTSSTGSTLYDCQGKAAALAALAG